MILRDNLAVDRTVLANERTFLAFVRTALTLFIGGISLIKFFNSFILSILGWVFILWSIVCLVVGFTKRKKTTKRIEKEIYQ